MLRTTFPVQGIHVDDHLVLHRHENAAIWSSDYASVQAAIDAVQADGDLGIVHIPPGRHDISNLTKTGTPLVLRGAGRDATRLVCEDGLALWAKSGNLVIEDLTLAGNGTGATGLKVGNDSGDGQAISASVTARNVRVTGFGTAGVHTVASQGSLFDGVVCETNGGDGLLIDDALVSNNTHTQFYSCSFRSNSQRGVLAYTAHTFSFYGCLFDSNGLEGVKLHRRQSNVGMENVFFDRCYFEGNNQTAPGAQFLAGSDYATLIHNLELRRCRFLYPVDPDGDYNLDLSGVKAQVWFCTASERSGVSIVRNHQNAEAYVTVHTDETLDAWQVEDGTTPLVILEYGPGGVTTHVNQAG